MDRLQERQIHISAGRALQCLYVTKNSAAQAAQLAHNRSQWADSQLLHRVLMAAVGAQSVGGDSALIPITGLSLMSVIAQKSVVDNLPGLTKVPFDTAADTTLGGAGSGWVGPGRAVPLSKLNFSRIGSLIRQKLSTIVVMERELVKSAAVDAQVVVGRDFARALRATRDYDALDPGNAGVAGVKPASLTYGSPSFASTGATVAAIDADLGRLVDSVVAHGSTLEFAVWVMHPLSAAFLARLRTTNGDRAYEDVSVLGGTLMGLPVMVTANLPHVGSPQSANIFLIDGSRVWLASDDAVEVDTSGQASLQMVDNPTGSVDAAPTMTTVTNLFQTGAVALRGNQTINFKIAEAGAAAVLNELSF